MSRLDLFIDRMVSQRACIDDAVARIVELSGPVLELGLGNGRTYDHLKNHLPGREIYVFDREVASHPQSTPPDDRIVLGDFLETLPAFLARMGPVAALIHADMGGHNADKNEAFARRVSALIEPLLARGGVMVSSDRMYFTTLVELPLPYGAVTGRCFLYRR